MAIRVDFRFEVGKTYSLTKWSNNDFGGTVVVKREMKPSDIHGTRILICDFLTDHGNFLGARGFVEPAYALGKAYLKRDGKKCEFMVLTGTQPFRAKAYAVNEVIKDVA